MAKLTLNTIGSRYGSIDALNDNSNLVEAAFENTLSRDGTGPNNMEADLDMDSNSIINVDEISAVQANIGSLLINGVPVAPTGLSFYGLGKETQVATSNQTVFNLGSLTYVQGINNIQVYVDGVYQNPSTYAETSTSSITFDAGLHVGAVVDFVLYYMDNLGYTVGSNATQYNPAGVGAVSTNVQTKLRETVSVKDFGAVGDGVTDDAAAIQAALNSISAVGGEVYFPVGDYLVTTAVRAKSNTTLFGDGYGSRIKCPPTGWVLTSTDIYGIITVKNSDNVKITGLRVYGTKLQVIGETPKLIYYENAKNLTVTQNYLENSAFEGIWSGGSGLDSPRFSITNNTVNNVGWPAGIYVGLPGIQTNGPDGIISNNVLNNVGTGIGASGRATVVANNFIKGITREGIGVGDNGEAAVGSGTTTIVGNHIEFEADPLRGSVFKGIGLGGSSGLNNLTNCIGNTIKIFGKVGAAEGVGIYVGTGENFSITNNAIEIDFYGRGIFAENAPVNRNVFIGNNVIRFTNEGASCLGIATRCATGYILNATLNNNFVYGLSLTYGSYSYDFPNQGTTNATMRSDISAGGQLRFADVNVNDGSLNNIPLSLRTNYSAISQHIHRPQIAMLNLQPALGGSNYVIAAGVLTITGTVASTNKNMSRINVDTEGAAATDDLTTITGGVSGDILILAAADSNRTVICKDGTGNMRLAGDFSLDNTDDRIVLMYEGTTWFELSRSDNGV